MTETWIVARRLRDDETHLGEPGAWRLVPNLFEQAEAERRARYFHATLSSAAIAVDLDSVEEMLGPR